LIKSALLAQESWHCLLIVEQRRHLLTASSRALLHADLIDEAGSALLVLRPVDARIRLLTRPIQKLLVVAVHALGISRPSPVCDDRKA